MASERISWVVTDGKAGMESQCLGLAEALGLKPIVKRVALRSPWRELTPHVRLFQSHAFAPTSDPILPPWPDLLIATGRQSIAASLIVRAESRKTGAPTLTIQLQNPVITPRHDRLTGANVVATKGALNRINRTTLARGAEALGRTISKLPRPYVSVLIGGSNDVYTLTPQWMSAFAADLVAAATAQKGSLLITPSRRTDAASLEVLKKAVAGVPHFLWDNSGDNPYFGLLGLADFIVVTSDSVNMVSEACATGKPVYVAKLKGGSAKFRRFHLAMGEDGMTRDFKGELVPFYYPALDDMSEVVARVRALLDLRRAD